MNKKERCLWEAYEIAKNSPEEDFTSLTNFFLEEDGFTENF